MRSLKSQETLKRHFSALLLPLIFMPEKYIQNSLILLSLIPAWRLHSLLKAKRFIFLIPNLMFISSFSVPLRSSLTWLFWMLRLLQHQSDFSTFCSFYASFVTKIRDSQRKVLQIWQKPLLALVKIGKPTRPDQVACSMIDAESFRPLFPCFHMNEHFRSFMLIYFLTLNKT